MRWTPAQRPGRVLRRLVRVQEDTPSRVAGDLTRALADAPPGATFVDELFFAAASATNDALLTNDPAAIAPALAAAEAACAAFYRALRQRQLPTVHSLNEAAAQRVPGAGPFGDGGVACCPPRRRPGRFCPGRRGV